MKIDSPYTKQNPFHAAIKERFALSKPGSQKNTQHLVLDLRDSGMTYQTGDCIGVFFAHDSHLVDKTLESLRLIGEETVYLKQNNESTSLREALLRKVNITEVSSKLFREVTLRQMATDKKHLLDDLAKEENREQLKSYLRKHEVWDFLHAHSEISFTAQEILDLLMPLLPRFYSISSAQKYVGNELHATVAPLEYMSNGHKRHGVCSHYLCTLVDLHNPIVPIFIQPSHSFSLPEHPDTPVIMIGPGTGVAPFRAFMQDRLSQQSQGKHWLFFGEWNREFDFFYEEDWLHFSKKTNLIWDLAFSRDQKEKVYVQHKMWEKGEELYRWLEEGAYLYVCGDAQRMAKDVESALHSVILQHGKKDEQGAKDYVKQLRKEKRYLRDVY